MLIIGIDPGISGSICFFQDGKIIDVVEMPTMTEGKKNKKQVNGSQIFNEILSRIKKLDKKRCKSNYRASICYARPRCNQYV
jgi:crossover junction endodeoxyribonuclease RuvC